MLRLPPHLLVLGAILLAACTGAEPGNVLDAGATVDAGDVGFDADLGAPVDEDASLDAAMTDSGVQDGALTDAGVVDADGPDMGSTDGEASDIGSADASAMDGSVGDAGSSATYRSSLSICWTDATCTRKLAVAHGGQWDVSTTPYDSNAAIEAAYNNGVDGVKIDVRVTADNVPVIAHSSPIEIFESVNCYNQRIEEMTAAEVTACHRFPSMTENFQRLDDVLNYLRGKMVAQLTVKRSEDYGRTIEEVLALNAEDFAFLEIDTPELDTLIPTLPGSDQVYYLINIESNYTEIDTLLDTIQNPRAFMIEMNPSPNVGTLITTRLHPANVRAFIYDSGSIVTVRTFEDLYDQGFDVISANAVSNLLTARMNVNQANGVSPP